MRLPDAVIDKLQDGELPMTHAAIIEGVDMIIRYTCDGKVIGQTMFHYAPETYVDWFRSMMNEMDPETGGSTKKNKIKKRPPPRGSPSRRSHSRKRESQRRG
jgi:hypothetical protein